MSGSDIIEINEIDTAADTININNSLDNMGGMKSTNFGSGIELLMNDKKKHSSSGGGNLTSDIDINDLNNLEDELNDITSDSKKSIKTARSDLFTSSIKLNESNNDDILEEPLSDPIKLGSSTKKSKRR